MQSARGRAMALLGAALALGLGVVAIEACGGVSGGSFTGLDGGGSSGDSSGGTSGTADSGSAGDDTGLHLGTDSGDKDSGHPHDSGPPPPPAVVYAHSPSVLYKLDPMTNAISVVASFSGDCASHGGCTSIIDLALDKSSNAYVTTFGAFFKLDLATAATTFIKAGAYPNSLSFVPAGTLDPKAEALVGYNGSTYIRIDTTTGVITNVGGLTGGYSSSGDIVSVIGGGTFLTVTGPSCGDCLLQVDPKTGDLLQNYGSVGHGAVFGIAYWAGTVYGFDNAGVMFSITFPKGKMVTTNIPFPSAPPGLQFWGAGSTTSAPPMQPDGGGGPPIVK